MRTGKKREAIVAGTPLNTTENTLCVEISAESLPLLQLLAKAQGYRRISSYRLILDRLIREEVDRRARLPKSSHTPPTVPAEGRKEQS